jgi:hypothetical protein
MAREGVGEAQVGEGHLGLGHPVGLGQSGTENKTVQAPQNTYDTEGAYAYSPLTEHPTNTSTYEYKPFSK